MQQIVDEWRAAQRSADEFVMACDSANAADLPRLEQSMNMALEIANGIEEWILQTRTYNSRDWEVKLRVALESVPACDRDMSWQMVMSVCEDMAMAHTVQMVVGVPSPSDMAALEYANAHHGLMIAS